MAITNDVAGIERRKQGNAATGNYGFAFCQPIFLDRSTFEGIPLKGRLRFAWGSAQNGDDLDYGFFGVHCVRQRQRAVALAFSLPVGTAMRPSFSFRRPPDTYQKDCQYTVDNPHWWDTGDERSAINRCPPWLYLDQSLLTATEHSQRQGVVHTVPAYDGQSPDWAGGDAKKSCAAINDIGGLDCHGVDDIYMMNLVERRECQRLRASIRTCRYFDVFSSKRRAKLDCPGSRRIPETYITGGFGPSKCKNTKGGESGSGRGRRCLIQPNTYFLANGGCYRLHYTGDIGLFERNEFTMLGARTTKPRHAIGKQTQPEWGVVLNILYLWPGKMNVYYNEKLVSAVGRMDRATVNQPAGTNYYHPASRELTLVVKAGMLADRVKVAGEPCHSRNVRFLLCGQFH